MAEHSAITHHTAHQEGDRPVIDVQSRHMTYPVNRVIFQQVGPAAVVHAILLANDDGDGSGITHKEVARAAGITNITARRSIDWLRDAASLKSEAQFRDAIWQLANSAIEA
jgi:hypothetical protein